jgi:hypothetical protein
MNYNDKISLVLNIIILTIGILDIKNGRSMITEKNHLEISPNFEIEANNEPKENPPVEY